MSVPKVIHYCWFGGAPKPPMAERCIASWRTHCPDYEIIEWNESNFDCSANRYAREAYEQKKWAFVSDYARLKIVCDRGGVYLDTDVELLRPLDDLLEGEGFLGFEDKEQVATGLGFGAVAGHPLIRALLEDYRDIPFVLEDGSPDLTPCPRRNTARLTALGLRADNTPQTLMGIRILPKEYLCPQGYYERKPTITANTHSIHHYSASWTSPAAKRSIVLRRLLGGRCYGFLYTRILSKIGGWEW